MTTSQVIADATPQIEYRHIWFDDLVETRLDESEPGTFKGYACRWDTKDTYRTSFDKRAFGGDSGGPLPLLWMHSPDKPVGVFSWRQDDEGLWIDGKYDDTPEGRAAQVRAKSSAPGLSVGFIRKANHRSDNSRITQAQLREVSQITLGFASQPGAELVAMRMVSEELEKIEERSDEAVSPADEPTTDEPAAPAKGSLEDKLIHVATAVQSWAEANHSGSDVKITGTYDGHVSVAVAGAEAVDLPYSVSDDGAVNLGAADGPGEGEANQEGEEARGDDEKTEAPEPKGEDQDEENPKPVEVANVPVEAEKVISEEKDEDGVGEAKETVLVEDGETSDAEDSESEESESDEDKAEERARALAKLELAGVAPQTR